MSTTSTGNKDCKGDTKTFRSVLAFRYKKVDLNQYFDVFQKKVTNYTIKQLKKTEDVLMIIKYPATPRILWTPKTDQNI